MLGFLSGLGNFALFIVALGVIIFVHELGHFATAKWVGIRVRRFAVGFGKPFLSYRKGVGFRLGATTDPFMEKVKQDLAARGEQPGELAWEDPKLWDAAERAGLGETEYALCALPLGGYVAMVGQEDLDPTKVSPDPRAYNNKPVWQRMIVVSAGVIMNILFAVVFFIGAFMWGVDFPPARVGSVVPGQPAASAVAVDDASIVGLKPGDRVLSINGDVPSDFNELRVMTALSGDEQKVELLVDRPAWQDRPQRNLRFRIAPEMPEDDQQDVRFLQIGITAPSSTQLVEPKSGKTREAIAAQLAEFGVEPGMTLVAVNGTPIDAHWQYLHMLNDSAGSPLELTFESANGERVTTTVQPQTQMQQQSVATVARRPDAMELIPHMLGLVPAIRIDDVVAGSPADGQLQPNDVVASIGQTPWPTIAQFIDTTANADGPIDIEVIRGSERQAFAIAPASQYPWSKPIMGVTITWAIDAAVIMDTLDDQPLASSGIPSGSRVLRIDGRPVASFADIRRGLSGAEAGEPITIDYIDPLLGGTEATTAVTLSGPGLERVAGLTWLDPIGAFSQLDEPLRAGGPITAARMGFDKTVLFVEQTYMTIVRLIDQTVSPTNLAGPVGIAAIGTRMADRGFSYLLYFCGLISVNLAVLNFLPLPILDGGLFVMLVLEKLRGKPLPLKVQSAISMVGLAMFAAIFLFVTYNDIARFFGG